MNEMTKRPWQSKTVVVNAVMGLLSAVAVFVPQATAIGEWINANAAEIGMAWGILNIILRVVTKEKVTLSD